MSTIKDNWRFSGDELKMISKIIKSGNSSSMSGSMNNIFERSFSKTVGAKFGISFNSGTSTLHAALHALGVGYGDEVIVPALTVIADLNVILSRNAIPIFADVDKSTFNIDPADIEKKITSKTKAIIIVPLYGLPCENDKIKKISIKYGIKIIHDAAQSPLAKYKGKPIASIFDITSFSFDATKHITTGDGGMITTNNKQTALKIRKFGCLGYKSLTAKEGRIRNIKNIFQSPNYSRHDEIGLNYRMSEFQAAVGIVQTKKLRKFVLLRRKIAAKFRNTVKNCEFLIPQFTSDEKVHSYWTFVVRLIDPKISWKGFRKKYIEFGGTGIYASWKLLYQEDVFVNGNWKKLCPNLYKNYKYKPCLNAELIQKQLLQFPLNFKNLKSAEKSIKALSKTINYYERRSFYTN
jgi:perosamine synthetase